ncbi:MAG: hypothetical protein GY724_05930 [Actinomycetia bacterium]|nr:hypothetical protein [Actinomycetes bacterium]
MQIAPDGLAITWKPGGAPSGQVAGRLGASFMAVLRRASIVAASHREADTPDAVVVSPPTSGSVHLELFVGGELDNSRRSRIAPC